MLPLSREIVERRSFWAPDFQWEVIPQTSDTRRDRSRFRRRGHFAGGGKSEVIFLRRATYHLKFPGYVHFPIAYRVTVNTPRYNYAIRVRYGVQVRKVLLAMYGVEQVAQLWQRDRASSAISRKRR